MYISCFSEPKAKKLYLLLFYIILINVFNYILARIIEKLEKSKKIEEFFGNNFIDASSEIFIIVFYFIGKICYKDKTNIFDGVKRFFLNNTIKDYVLFICVIIIYHLNNIYYLARDKGFTVMNTSKNILFILILSLFSKFVGDFIFYRHKILGLTMCFIVSFFIDLCNYYTNGKPYFNESHYIFTALNQIFSGVFYTYVKYLMSDKLLSLYIIIPFFGFNDLIFNLVKELIGLKYGNKIMSFNNEPVTFSIFAKKKPKKIFTYLMINFIYIVVDAIYYIIYYQVLHDFDTCHLGLIMVVSRITSLIEKMFEKKENVLYWIVFFLTILLLMSILFFLEILEIKICGLNKNTRRSILLREKMENVELEKLVSDEDEYNENNRDSNCEIGEGYIVDMSKFKK